MSGGISFGPAATALFRLEAPTAVSAGAGSGKTTALVELCARLLSGEALGETSFQVPAYLLAASRALPGRTRLEATYALLRKAARVEPLAVDPGDPLLAPSAHAAADGPRTFAAGVVSAVQRIRAGEFPIAPRACEGCAFGAVCRSEGAAAAADADDAEGGGA